MEELIQYFLPNEMAFLIVFIFSFWWIWFPPLAWKFFKEMYTDYAVGNFKQKNWDFVLLEIILESGEAKTPKSMEKVITTLHGGRTGWGWWDINIKGAKQDMFSLEIVSINGEIHYIIRTLKKYKKLVEGAVYGAFPDVDIQEVEDYVRNIDRSKLEIDYDVFGANIGLAKPEGYPIRTYMEFLDDDKDIKINDPMSQILEVMASLEPGEQLWMQINIESADDNWTQKGMKEIEKLTGQSFSDDRTILEKYVAPVMEAISFGLVAAPKPPEKPEQKFGIAQNLTPGKAEAIKAIEHNITKPGFKCSMRYVYIAQKATYAPASPKAFMGSLKQFNDHTLNSFKIDGKSITSEDDIFGRSKKDIERLRKNLLLDNYAKRKMKDPKFIFNTEELTTIYHFPSSSVTTSTLKRVRSKRASAPSSLPIVDEI